MNKKVFLICYIFCLCSCNNRTKYSNEDFDTPGKEISIGPWNYVNYNSSNGKVHIAISGNINNLNLGTAFNHLKDSAARKLETSFSLIHVTAAETKCLLMSDQFKFSESSSDKNFKVNIIFDNGPKETFEVSKAPNDDSSRALVFDNPQKILSELKRSKIMSVEVLTVENGGKILKFNTDSLIWKYK